MPKDQHFPDRKPVCEVTLNGEELKKEEIFVVKSYDDKFSSSQVSTLLANAELRSKYEEIHKNISEAKRLWIKLSGMLQGSVNDRGKI